MKRNLFSNAKIALASVMGAAVIFAFTGCAYEGVSGLDEQVSVQNFVAGNHTATTAGAWGPISVTLHTNTGEITGITVEHQETGIFVDSGFTSIQSSILQGQTPHGVDTIAGATVSTEPLLAAARQAFAYATGETTPATPGRFVAGTYMGITRDYTGGIGEGATVVNVTFDANSIVSVEIISHMNTGENITDEDNEALIVTVLENQGVDGLRIEDAPNATTNFVGAINWTIDIAKQQFDFVLAEAPLGSGSNNIATGVYITSFAGRNDDIVVGLGIVDGTIIRAVTAHRETSYFVDEAILQIVNQIVNEQTVYIDTVAGATFSTRLIIEGFRELFDEAHN